MAALAAAGALPLPARAGANLKMMIPANPGGGWDTTGRALGKALQDAGVAAAVQLRQQGRRGRRHRPGAVRQRAARATATRMMVMGAVMLGGIITGKPPVSLTQATPIARLTSEYNVFVLPAELAAEDHEGRGRAAEEGPGQRQVGRRLARLHRAHRRGDDRARGRRRPGQDQLRRLPRRRRGHGGHPGRQRHRRRQRLQRVRRVHQHRQDARRSPSPPTRA